MGHDRVLYRIKLDIIGATLDEPLSEPLSMGKGFLAYQTPV